VTRPALRLDLPVLCLLACVLCLLAGSSSCHERKPETSADATPEQQESSPDATPEPPPEVTSSEEASQALGQEVRFRGRAGNGKLAAAVVVEQLLVYCLDRSSWPDELVGQEVVVQGVLEYTEEFVAQVAPDGAISQGTGGGVFILRTSELLEGTD